MCTIRVGKMSYGLNKTLQICTVKIESGLGMGGAAGTAGTAAAVPLLREVRQDKVLPYHILVKEILKQ